MFKQRQLSIAINLVAACARFYWAKALKAGSKQPFFAVLARFEH
jgi:hypothetical protein